MRFMAAITKLRAIIVRVLFGLHGIMALWRVYMATLNPVDWLFGAGLILLAVESFVTVKKNDGKEWKWFCPSVFFYLLTVVPPIWKLELGQLAKKVEAYTQQQLISINITGGGRVPNFEALIENFSFPFPDYDGNANRSLTTAKPDLNGGLDDDVVKGLEELNKMVQFSPDAWSKILEQGLLLLLILGRWLLPKGKLTHDQLSQLLLVYIGTAADIVEFFEVFKDQVLVENPNLSYPVLSIWSWSLLQFTMVMTATKARKDRSGVVQGSNVPGFLGELNPGGFECCTPEVYGILISICWQDGPYFIFRMVLIIHYRALSYSNFFFTVKNTFVITLLMYRLVIVQVEKKREHDRRKIQYYHMRDSCVTFGKSLSLPMFATPSSPEKRGYFQQNGDINIEMSNLLIYNPILVRKAPHASLETLDHLLDVQTPYMSEIYRFDEGELTPSLPRRKFSV